MRPISTLNHPIIGLISWQPEKAAVRINDHILASASTSNSYLVTSSDGDVLVNSGTGYQGVRHRERFETMLGRPLDVRKIIFTQSHPDHMGGWAAFAHPAVETIVQREFVTLSNERKLLGSYFMPRGQRVLSSMMPKKEHMQSWYSGTRDPEGLTMFSDKHVFEVGSRCFELYSVPSGETLDSLLVWLPDERTLFTGNWMGAIYGALPHFYTPRGDRQRSVPRFLRDLNMVIGLDAEMLITGHGEPIVGKTRIAADLHRLRDAVAYIHDHTVKGMNDHKNLATLMTEIALPPQLELAAGRGPVHWYVRAVWEEYAGWFSQESTTELYAIPPRAIWAELTAMAGGASALVQRAQQHVAKGEAVQALHFVDIAKSTDPSNRDVLRAEVAALECLVEANAGKAFDELGWLENEIARITTILKQ